MLRDLLDEYTKRRWHWGRVMWPIVPARALYAKTMKKSRKVNEDMEDMDDMEIVNVGFDMDNPESENFMSFHSIPYGELRKMHQQIKDSTYNTVLGCLVSAVSKLLDEELIELTTV